MVGMAVLQMDQEQTTLIASRRLWQELSGRLPKPKPDPTLVGSTRAQGMTLEQVTAGRVSELLRYGDRAGESVLRLVCRTPEAELLLRLARGERV